MTIRPLQEKVFLLPPFEILIHNKLFALYFWKENPDYESTYVFENDFPALLQEEAPAPGKVNAAYGNSDILCSD